MAWLCNELSVSVFSCVDTDTAMVDSAKSVPEEKVDGRPLNTCKATKDGH